MRNQQSHCEAGRSTGAAFHIANEEAAYASIVHEIRQPLAAIVSDASACRRWLAASPPNHARVEVIVGRILENAAVAAEIVGEIGALFTQQVGPHALVQLNDVIRDACASVAHDGQEEQVEVSLQLDRSLPPFSLNRIQIRQLLINLMRNGIEAMEVSEGRPQLQVRSRCQENGARVEICDRGCGLVDAGRIFDPFFSTKTNGMGIGLAICRQIVAAHGGRLWMEQAHPCGTRMIFTLPSRNAEAGAASGVP